MDSQLTVIIRVPLNYPDSEIPKLLEKHSDWIGKALSKRRLRNLAHPQPSDGEIAELKKRAEEVLPGKVEYFSKLTGLSPTGVRITSAKKRFGSCSGKNSVCFSYLLMRYPEPCIDYVVLHEIAHIKYHDHSKKFYAFIESYMPDFRRREKLLRST